MKRFLLPFLLLTSTLLGVAGFCLYSAESLKTSSLNSKNDIARLAREKQQMEMTSRKLANQDQGNAQYRAFLQRWKPLVAAANPGSAKETIVREAEKANIKVNRDSNPLLENNLWEFTYEVAGSATSLISWLGAVEQTNDFLQVAETSWLTKDGSSVTLTVTFTLPNLPTN